MTPKFERDFLDSHLTPPDGPISALRHVVEVFEAKEDDQKLAIMATSGMYGDKVKTGLSWGDLASLLALIDKASALVDKLEGYAKSARDDGDVDRAMAYGEAAQQLRNDFGG